MKLQLIALNLIRLMSIVLVVEKIQGNLIEKQVECQEANYSTI